jgi:hypothetical protein
MTALAAALERQRARYNALVRGKAIDIDAFSRHLREVVAPAVESVHSIDLAAVDAVTSALYEMSVDLFAASLLGPNSRSGMVRDTWSALLPSTPRVLRLDPRRVAGAVTNAALNIESYTQSGVEKWIALMRQSGGLAEDVPAFLALGRVAAWRAGMAHQRDAALDSCGTLKPSLAWASLGISGEPGDIASRIALLREDPWIDPTQPGGGRTRKIVARVGGFRGFGGQFITPPVVTLSGASLVVNDAERSWTLHADRFGATLVRSDQPPGKPSRLKAALTFPELADATSTATNGTTLVVATRYSHAVAVVAEV